VPRHRVPPPTASKPQAARESGQYLAQAFSDIELLVAIDVVKSAISEGRKHVDVEALKSVLSKLTSAYDWKKRNAG